MARATECLSLPLTRTQKPAMGWLKGLLGRLPSRGGQASGAGRPTKLGPGDLSSYLMKDIGLSKYSLSAEDARSGRSLMDWPVR